MVGWLRRRSLHHRPAGPPVEIRSGLVVREVEQVLGSISALVPPLGERSIVPTTERSAGMYPSGKQVASLPA